MEHIEYTITKTDIDTYNVEARQPGHAIQVEEGFRSEEQAKNWIAEQRRKAAAVAKWEQTSIGRMHKDD